MLLIRKKEISDSEITYYYQPECKGEEGIIVYYSQKKYSRNNPDYKIEKLAELDFGIEYSSSPYRAHTIHALRKFAEEGSFPDEKFIAWG